jgi:tryptophan synthase beta subunit
MKLAPHLKDQIIVVNLSGRGDKDVDLVSRRLDGEQFESHR